MQQSTNKDLIPRFWFCLLFTFPFFVRRLDVAVEWPLATIVLVAGNWSFFLAAKSDRYSKYMLFCVALALLYLYGLYGMVATVTLFVLLQEIFVHHITMRAKEAVAKLLARAPKKAKKLFLDGRTEEISCDEIKDDDTFRVAPGELVPVDGVLFSGDGVVDESFITGSDRPVEKVLGSQVYAATKNLKGTFLVRTIRTTKKSIYSQLVALAQDEPTGESGKAFVVAAFAVAGVGFLFWALFSSLANAVLVASTLLVGLAPVAFILSSRLIKLAALGQAASQGIALRPGVTLDQVAACTTLVVNKNGTLTTGKPTIVSIDPANGATQGELLQVAASLEANSIHPYAVAIVDKAVHLSQLVVEVLQRQEVQGLGVKGVIGQDLCLIGDEKLVEGLELGYHKARAEDMRKQGYIVLFCAKGQKLLGCIVLSDPVRSDVKDALKAFKEEGFTLFCLSADRRVTVVQLVNALGFNRFQAEATAPQKVATIKKLQSEQRRVLMIGDPLEQADVSVSLGTKGDLLQEKASITLLDPTLSAAVRLLALSKQYARIDRQNRLFIYSFMAYMLIAGLFGYTGPSHAALYMLLSTMAVGYNCLRITSRQK